LILIALRAILNIKFFSIKSQSGTHFNFACDISSFWLAFTKANSVGTSKVLIIPLDAILEKEGFGDGTIKLIKIDIEGYEYTALKAALKTLGRAQHILTEFSPYMTRDIGQDPVDYINLLQSAGFKLKLIDEHGLSEPDIATIIRENQQVNLFGSKSGVF
jgi:Methyltransferase FkbM domain